MRFRLTYEGPVCPTGGDPRENQKNPLAEHKHLIRREFSGQLKPKRSCRAPTRGSRAIRKAAEHAMGEARAALMVWIQIEL
jgi:hypothetical protein